MAFGSAEVRLLPPADDPALRPAMPSRSLRRMWTWRWSDGRPSPG